MVVREQQESLLVIAAFGVAPLAVARFRPALVMSAFCGRPAPLDLPLGCTRVHLSIADLNSPSSGGCPRAGPSHLATFVASVARLPGGATLLVTCRAGISRSSALAIVAAEVLALGGASAAWRTLKSSGVPFRPNTDVLRTAHRVLGGPDAMHDVVNEVAELPADPEAVLAEPFPFLVRYADPRTNWHARPTADSDAHDGASDAHSQ